MKGCAIAHAASRTYTITPDPGYKVAALVVDGVTRPAATSYTFSFIQEDHSIHAIFTRVDAPTGTIEIDP